MEGLMSHRMVQEEAGYRNHRGGCRTLPLNSEQPAEVIADMIRYQGHPVRKADLSNFPGEYLFWTDGEISPGDKETIVAMVIGAGCGSYHFV